MYFPFFFKQYNNITITKIKAKQFGRIEKLGPSLILSKCLSIALAMAKCVEKCVELQETILKTAKFSLLPRWGASKMSYPD